MVQQSNNGYINGIFNDEISEALVEYLKSTPSTMSDKKIKREIDEFLKCFYSEDSVQEFLANCSNSHRNRQVENTTRETKQFERRLYKSYEIGIKSYISLLELVLEAMDSYRHIVYKNTGCKDDEFFHFLLRLHAKIYRNANEIITLIKSGYGSGAFARWRTMYETTVVLSYVAKTGPFVAEVMKDHSVTYNYKMAVNYRKYQDKLNEQPISDAEVNEIQAEYDRVLEKYKKYFNRKKDFGKDYGWAQVTSANKIHSFRELAEESDYSHLYPYYTQSNLVIHSSWKSLEYGEEYDSLLDPGIYLLGPTNYGFTEAVSLSVITLAQATTILLTRYPSLESMLYAKMIIVLAEQTEEQFNKSEKTITNASKKADN